MQWGWDAGLKALIPPPTRAQATSEWRWTKWGKNALSGDGTNAHTDVGPEAVVAPERVTRIEAEVAGVKAVAIVGAPDRRPAVAAAALVGEASEPMMTRGRQEHLATIRTSEFPDIHAVERSPDARAVGKQLLNLLHRGRIYR